MRLWDEIIVGKGRLVWGLNIVGDIRSSNNNSNSNRFTPTLLSTKSKSLPDNIARGILFLGTVLSLLILLIRGSHRCKVTILFQIRRICSPEHNKMSKSSQLVPMVGWLRKGSLVRRIRISLLFIKVGMLLYRPELKVNSSSGRVLA